MSAFQAEMTVLITAISLGDLGGSTLYVRDLALRLRAIGHRPVVYTPQPGPVAAELDDATIAVVTSLDSMAEPPDVIHGNHTVETVEAAFRFPGVPIVFVCHGWNAWMAEPPVLSSVMHYIGVTRACRDRMVLSGSVPDERCSVLPNGVDVERFALRQEPLPPTPRRGLVFSNNAVEGGYLDLVRKACDERDIELDVIGSGVGRSEPHPETVLASYDLVFARGRCALEAMSCGAAVVLVDIEGLGPMITLDNVDDLRLDGFGRRVLANPHEVDLIGAEIDRYDPDEATALARHVRTSASLEAMTAELVERYDEAIRLAPALEVDAAADLDWLLDYLPRLSQLGHERDHALLTRHQLATHCESITQRLLDTEAARVGALEMAEEAGLESGAARAELEQVRAELESVRIESDSVRVELDQVRGALTALRATKWFRIRDRALALPGVRHLYSRGAR